MKPSSTFRRAAMTLVSLAAVASAWPAWLPAGDALIARQDGSNTGAVTTPTPTQTQTQQSSQTGPRTGNLNTGATGTQRTTPTGGFGPPRGNSTGRPTFAPDEQAGSVVMITPAPTAGTQLYKVGTEVTWAWNYTNLLGTPTAIDVLVSCGAASRTWTLTQNMTFATRADFLWDTNKYQNLVVEEYTLLVHDSEIPMTARAEPGYLQPFNGFKFGVYTPAGYTPLASGWQCVSCNGAAPGIDKNAARFALIMGALTVATFTWFVTGFGVLTL